MIKKKTIATSAAVISLLMTLTACGSGGGLGSNTVAIPPSNNSVDPAVATAAKNFKGTFTYWTGLTFPDEGNAIEKSQIEQWGKNLGIKVAFVHEYRGSIVFPTSTGSRATNSSGIMSAQLEIRILRGVATYQVRNMLGDQYQVIPDFYMPRAVSLYGIRWEFWN